MGLRVGQSRKSKGAWRWAQRDTGEKEKAKAAGGSLTREGGPTKEIEAGLGPGAQAEKTREPTDDAV